MLPSTVPPSLIPPSLVPPSANNPESPSNNHHSVSNEAIPTPIAATPPTRHGSSLDSWALLWEAMSIRMSDLLILDPYLPTIDEEEEEEEEEEQTDDDAPYESDDDAPFESDGDTPFNTPALAEEPIKVQFDISLLLKFPPELRTRIYTHILLSPSPILPHLCVPPWLNETTPAKFHDDNAPPGRHGHNSIHRLTSLTRASRKLREESLPVFYAVNTFATGDDLSTYLAYLEEVGRLGWVKRVELVVGSLSVRNAAGALRGVGQFDEEVKEYEQRSGAVEAGSEQPPSEKGSAADASSSGTTVYTTALRNHPRYQVSGLSTINLALLLRFLSTPNPSPTSPFPRKIVLPVSNTAIFSTEPRLQGLAKLAQGLDLELRLLEQPGSATREGSVICIRWDRRYQKREDAVTVEEGGGGKSVLDRARELYPDLEEMARPKGCSFYRTDCGGEVTWFDVKTMGGERR